MICSGGDSLDDLGLPCFGNDGGGAISHQGCTGWSGITSWPDLAEQAVNSATEFAEMTLPSNCGFSYLIIV